VATSIFGSIGYNRIQIAPYFAERAVNITAYAGWVSQDTAWHGPKPLHNPLEVARLGEIYSRTAAFYDEIVAARQAPTKLRAIEMLARQPGEVFVEVGAGTAWAFARVVEDSGIANAYAVDVASGMLEVARDVLTERAVVAPSLVAGDGRRLPFPDASIDCLLNSYTFEVMGEADIRLMLVETMRVLRPTGRAVIANLTDATNGGTEDEAMIADWKARYEADPEFFGGARPLQLESMLCAHGFDPVTRVYVGPDWPSEVLLATKPG
jgi:ubiquinone/menaquinone biosynthesis C-methylase UbiE